MLPAALGRYKEGPNHEVCDSGTSLGKNVLSSVYGSQVSGSVARTILVPAEGGRKHVVRLSDARVLNE